MTTETKTAQRFCARCNKNVKPTKRGHCPDCSSFLPAPKKVRK